MSSITCPHCQKSFERGQVYCPHCFLKLPGAMWQVPQTPARRAPASPRTPSAPRVPSAPRAPRAASEPAVVPVPAPRSDKAPRLAGAPRRPAVRAPKSAGECPACGHGVTSTDTWCKWCHWPVNRKV